MLENGRYRKKNHSARSGKTAQPHTVCGFAAETRLLNRIVRCLGKTKVGLVHRNLFWDLETTADEPWCT